MVSIHLEQLVDCWARKSLTYLLLVCSQPASTAEQSGAEYGGCTSSFVIDGRLNTVVDICAYLSNNVILMVRSDCEIELFGHHNIIILGQRSSKFGRHNIPPVLAIHIANL